MNLKKTVLLMAVCLTQTAAMAQYSSIVPLNPLPDTREFATREKHQSKVFHMGGSYWAILGDNQGTHIWQLEGTTWVHALKLSNTYSISDHVVAGNVVHVLLYSGAFSQFISVEYNPGTKKFDAWKQNPSLISIKLEEGIKLASIEQMQSGRLWIASNGTSGDINVRWSDAPYTNWSKPITLEKGVREDDMCALIALPQAGRIGILWSNQNTKRWGFRTHKLGDAPEQWSEDEVPAAQSAQSQGSGMADDHMSMKVSKNGTLYCAVKTGFNKQGFPLLALLVRRPSGVWDAMYEVSQTGTVPILLLNEDHQLLRVVYTAATYGGDIIYRESSMKNIAFCEPQVLISGEYNYPTSTKQRNGLETVILASTKSQVVGVKVSDDKNRKTLSCAGETDYRTFRIYPNPFNGTTTLEFSLLESSVYSLRLYDSRGRLIKQFEPQEAMAYIENSVELDGKDLHPGVYYIRLSTPSVDRSYKVVVH